MVKGKGPPLNEGGWCEPELDSGKYIVALGFADAWRSARNNAGTMTTSAQAVTTTESSNEKILYRAKWNKSLNRFGVGLFVLLAFLSSTGLTAAHFIVSAVFGAIAIFIWKSYNFKEVSVSDRRVVYKRGVIMKQTTAIPLERIDSVTTRKDVVEIVSGSIFNKLTPR